MCAGGHPGWFYIVPCEWNVQTCRWWVGHLEKMGESAAKEYRPGSWQQSYECPLGGSAGDNATGRGGTRARASILHGNCEPNKRLVSAATAGLCGGDTATDGGSTGAGGDIGNSLSAADLADWSSKVRAQLQMQKQPKGGAGRTPPCPRHST
jgi:hypothetical protein